MKKTITLSILSLFNFAVLQAQGQREAFGGEVIPPRQNVCLTDEHRHEIRAELAASRSRLVQQGILPERSSLRSGIGHPLFQWPLIKNPASPYESTWAISGYVDHNETFPNQLKDYNCGTRTYDTAAGYNHAGVDIFTFPFPWYQMDNDQSWAVAAAPGVIVARGGSQFDRSCDFNNNVWNGVYIEHSDGSIAWYGHLKKNSLTTKALGESVIAGEFLGVIGSSGNSTGPHLHFEVYDAADNLVDPYSGTCNTWGAANDSWWASQKPYLNTKINAFLSHSAPPIFNACPQTEVPNLQDNFNVGETVYAAVYLADQLPGTTANIRIYKPNGSMLYNFNQSLTASYYSSYWFWAFPGNELPDTGTYTMTYTYQGNTVAHNFTYGTLAVADVKKSTLEFYPNPATNQILFSENIKSLEVFHVDGKKLTISHTATDADISSLPNGIFILRGIAENDIPFTKKLVK